jgi:DNA repair protein RadC
VSDYPEIVTQIFSSILKDAPVHYLEFIDCPHCHESISLTLRNLEWTIRSPLDITSRLLAQSRDLQQEYLTVLSLTTKNRVLEQTTLYVGNVNTALVRISEVVREPIRLNAAGLILCHNHPSGDPTPSPDDLHLTAEVLAACRLLDIDFIDHIVLGGGSYVSLRDRGIQFTR